MKRHVLFVDDEPSVLNAFRRLLRANVDIWEMQFVTSANEALTSFHACWPEVIVTDVRMPIKDGFALLQEVHECVDPAPVPVIVVTGNGEHGLKRRALESGAADLLHKPVDPEELVARVNSVLRLKDYDDRLRADNTYLEAAVAERTEALRRSRHEVIWRLAKAAELRDSETGNHTARVGWISNAIAQALDLDAEFVDLIAIASSLHDVGKIGVPDAILLKTGKLTAEEQEMIRLHCVTGARILSEPSTAMRVYGYNSGAPRQRGGETAPHPLLKMAASIAMSHHERWDGTGYPAGLARESIPLEARITALADVYDALRSVRPYKRSFSPEDALGIIRATSGAHFDPANVAAFERAFDRICAIDEDLRDRTTTLEAIAA